MAIPEVVMNPPMRELDHSEIRLKAAIAELLGTNVKPQQLPTYTDKLHLLAFRDPVGRERR
jgi:hypothetical protein